MVYKLENFLVQVSSTDRLLKIKESSGIIKHSIDGFAITSLRAINNIVKVVTKSSTIDLDFSTTNEARIALSRIQTQIDLLKEKNPLFLDKKISNYISETISNTFSSLEMFGLATFQQTTEKIKGVTESGLSPSTIYFDFDESAIWYVDTLYTNFIADFINIPLTDNRRITATIVLPQGPTAYVPTSFAINNSNVSVLWEDGATAVGNPNQTDIIDFSFYRYGGTWSDILAYYRTFL